MAAARQESLEKESKGAHDSWGRRIQQHVDRRWHPPPGSKGKEATVKITISNSGFISSGINIISCTGAVEFCSSVEEAFERSEPFPAPPSKYNFSKSDRTIIFKMD